MLIKLFIILMKIIKILSIIMMIISLLSLTKVVGTLITLEMVLMEVIMNYLKLNLQELVIIFIIIQVLNKMKFMLLLKKI